MKLDSIRARQVLDSRGNPTIEVEASYGEYTASAISPSGASKGKYEAHELRDENAKIYNGNSVHNAISKFKNIIAPKIKNIDFENQNEIDDLLIQMDGTENKSNLGANTILATSLAVAKLSAKLQKKPLYKYINELLDTPEIHPSMPTPFVNILNGGMHADNQIDIQEFMIVPVKSMSFHEKIRICSEIFHALRKILKQNGLSINVGDEGGFAPNLKGTEEALDYITKSIVAAGYELHTEVALALDIAASSFWKKETNSYELEKNKLSTEKMVNHLCDLVERYGIISIEDGLDEEDHLGWQKLTARIGTKTQLIGDDLFVTNKKLLKVGIENHYANSILIKPNQVGTLTETLDTIRMAHQCNFQYMISHRSGESEDTTIAHIAVGSGSKQIKTGSVCRGERTAKYNELIRIEESL